jgi:hypothetical protein
MVESLADSLAKPVFDSGIGKVLKFSRNGTPLLHH